MKKKVQKIIYKNIKIDGLIHDCMDDILEPSLREAVKKTSTPLDDIALEKFYPELAKVLKEKITEIYSDLLKQDEIA